LTGTPTTISATASQPFSGTVATFTDTDTVTATGDLSATINWGDGTPATAGTISGSSGSFTVSGTHTYSASGTDQVTVTSANDAPGTPTATANSTANVAGGTLTGQETLSSATEHVALPGTTQVATFTDTNTTD